MNPKKIKKEDLNDFHTAYHWLENHPKFQGQMLRLIDLEIVKVNPKTLKIDDDKKKNTKLLYWIEPSVFEKLKEDNPWYIDVSTTKYHPIGDLDLYAEADSFEKIIIKLAKKIFKKYGTYTNKESEIALLIPLYKTKKKAKKEYESITFD